MKYINANVILPKQLLQEIQKYVDGETLYIPKKQAKHQKWGTISGTRKRLDERNEQIRSAFANGTSIEALAAQYYLSPETIKKIVYRSRV